MATTAVAVETTVALDEIHIAENVRALDTDHVHALAESIRLRGMLVPVVVQPAEREVAVGGGKYELVAGFHGRWTRRARRTRTSRTIRPTRPTGPGSSSSGASCAAREPAGGAVSHAVRACGPRRDRPRTERGHDQKGWQSCPQES